MARLTWVGSPHNFEIVTSVRIVESGGDEFDVTNSVSGDIKIVPAKRATVDAVSNGEVYATVKGATTAGSIEIPLDARAWTDVEVAGNPTLFEALAQTNTGTGFEPFQVVPMSGFDGDTKPDLVMSPSDKCFQIVIELQPARSGHPTAIRGQVITVYAAIETPEIAIANTGGVSKLSIKGAIKRRGMIALSTV